MVLAASTKMKRIVDLLRSDVDWEQLMQKTSGHDQMRECWEHIQRLDKDEEEFAEPAEE